MHERFAYSTIQELQGLLRAGAVSPVEILTECLARIEALNPRLNAFITVFGVQARQDARDAESALLAGEWRGPLHGVPVGIKDFYDTAGLPTTAGFGAFKDRIPRQDAVAVEKLKQAGAVIVGKMNMHQLGMGTTGLDSYFGAVRNPWNPAYIPGGSSSGSAAAVAAGLCYATLDTDAIGSCRLPASCCGVVGFKGTYGLISGKGILEGEKADDTILWLSHPGITTRSVEDTALMLNVLADTGRNNPARDFHHGALQAKRLRIGAGDRFKADHEVWASFEAALQSVRSLGHEVVSAPAPFETPRFGDLRTIDADRKSVSEQWFGGLDVVVLPTTTTTVIAVEDARANPQALAADNTMFANYFGLPAISVPCGFDARGLPLGLEIVGKPGEEATVLGLARQFESIARLSGNHPAI